MNDNYSGIAGHDDPRGALFGGGARLRGESLRHSNARDARNERGVGAYGARRGVPSAMRNANEPLLERLRDGGVQFSPSNPRR